MIDPLSPNLFDQDFGKLSFAVFRGFGQIFTVTRLSIDAISMVEAELSENLPVATMPLVEREKRRDRLKVQIVTRPIDGLQYRAETGLHHRFAGKDTTLHALLQCVEL